MSVPQFPPLQDEDNKTYIIGLLPEMAALGEASCLLASGLDVSVVAFEYSFLEAPFP